MADYHLKSNGWLVFLYPEKWNSDLWSKFDKIDNFELKSISENHTNMNLSWYLVTLQKK